MRARRACLAGAVQTAVGRTLLGLRVRRRNGRGRSRLAAAARDCKRCRATAEDRDGAGHGIQVADMRRPGLSARVTAAFAGRALVLSTAMALASYELTRGSLLAERERTAIRTTYFDATVVQAGPATENPDVVEVLR